MRTVKEDLQTSSIIKTYIHTYTLFLIFIKILFKQIIYIYAYNIIEMKLISTRAAEEKNFFCGKSASYGIVIRHVRSLFQVRSRSII